MGTIEGQPRNRRRWMAAGAAVLLLAGAVFVLVWFQPHKLLIDDRVDEAFPVVATTTVPPSTSVVPATTVAPSTSTPATLAPRQQPQPVTTAPPATVATTVAPGPLALRQGSFVSLDHDTSGVAVVYRLEDGSNVLRITDLATDNGPDLFVYLTSNPASGPEGAFDDAFVNLGRMKGNLGNQNYVIPAGVDLDAHSAVVIWCDRFDSAFGAADLV